MINLYKYIAIALLWTIIGFFAGLLFIPVEVVNLINAMLLVFMVALLICSIFVKWKSKHSTGTLRFSMWFVYLFSFIEGVCLYPALMFYLHELGVLMFAEAVIGTMAIFAIMAYIGQKNKSGAFNRWWIGLYPALWVLVIMSAINYFARVDLIDTILAGAGIIIFSGYIVYDINKSKEAVESGHIKERDEYSIYVLNIYLDLINLLIDILRILYKIKKMLKR